ncbi:DUF4198 domain-containing protein [Lysobacter sp. GX 14042]|uniref:DUF4198 domain-containing protein n=1 Tax=Lysobacter sp. GX 14042 TaxID=2907155 RepID=UPI001F2BEBDB|nr:DUF4198 domain-containing protein [Lysobacter sp. GX 14042]MCE7031839.1 DUF4198 domain-containing protein [Lysobacter sp. GX 14042]
MKTPSTKSKKLHLIGLAAALAFCLAPPAFAHKAWLKPSATVFSETGAWMTVDAAVSNDLFYFNHVPLRLDNLRITAPDGSSLEPVNPATGKYRSVFDLQLEQEGTYRLSVVNDGLFARYTLDGESKRWRGSPAEFETAIPAGASDVEASQTLSRVETFVTVGAPSQDVFATTGQGIELVPVTHPNDLYAGEAATFQLLLDGEPAAGLEIEIVPGGTRYRDSQDSLAATTGADGRFEVTWPEAGMYWLETGSSDDRTTLPQASQRRLGYVATFEVLPL